MCLFCLYGCCKCSPLFVRVAARLLHPQPVPKAEVLTPYLGSGDYPITGMPVDSLGCDAAGAYKDFTKELESVCRLVPPKTMVEKPSSYLSDSFSKLGAYAAFPKSFRRQLTWPFLPNYNPLHVRHQLHRVMGIEERGAAYA
jgi:hypothetical protein